MKNLLTKLTESLIAYHPEVINYDEFKHSAIFLPLIEIKGKMSLLFEKRNLLSLKEVKSVSLVEE